MTITGYEAPVLEFDKSAHGEDFLDSAFRHEDGSITYVLYQRYDQEFANPREDDGNVTNLVQDRNDRMVSLDDPDDGIKEARDRFDDYDRSEVGARKLYPGSDLDEFYWGRHVLLQARSKHDAESMVRRYISICRPDIAHYQHQWQVTGSSQSDWAGGWGFILTEDMDQVTCTAQEAWDQEVDVYGQYFAGEVYEACHVVLGDPIVALGEQGAHITGWDTTEDWCGGFLAYKDTKEIAMQMTSSPIIDTLY